MLGIRMYFWDDWPLPPAGGGPGKGSMMLLGVGRMLFVILMLEGLLKWIS